MLSFPGLAPPAVEVCLVRPGPRGISRFALPNFQSLSEPPCLHICAEQVGLGFGKVRIHVQHGARLRDRSIILPRAVINCSTIGSYDQRQWIELSCSLTLGKRFVKPSLPGKVLGIPLVSCGIVRIELNGPPKFFLRL